LPGPSDDGVDDDGGAVDDGKCVVPGRQSSPLLDVAVATLDHVSVLVVDGVRLDGSSVA
jgi:hypothetical protein